MRLYGYWRSSASWRVRIGLGLKGVAYEPVPVHLVRDGGEQKKGDHLLRNPMAQVPVLEVEIDGKPVWISQSIAILEYLDETIPEPPLFPADPLGRARVRMLAEIVNSGIQPLQNLTVTAMVNAMGGDSQAWTATFIRNGLTSLEALARDTAGRFLVGDAPTLADCCLAPQLYAARRFAVDLEPFPTLRAVEEACYELPAFQAAHADQQPEAVP